MDYYCIYLSLCPEIVGIAGDFNSQGGSIVE